jgi:hypothetical protein
MADERAVRPAIPPRPSSDLLRLAVFFLLAAGMLFLAVYFLLDLYTKYASPRSYRYFYLQRPSLTNMAMITAGLFCAATVFFGLALHALLNVRGKLNARRERLAQLASPALPDRAKRAAEALEEATLLFDALRTELDTRAAMLDDAKKQLAETTRRTDDLQRLAREDPEIIRMVDTRWDEALDRRFRVLERGALLRELLLGTVGAVVFGLIAILLSHYFFGF